MRDSIDEATSAALAVTSGAQQSTVAETQLASVPAPRYAQFVILSICSSLVASVVSFTIANGEARGEWNSVPLTVIATVACLLFLNAAIKSASRLRQIGGANVLLRRKKLIYRNISFACLFIGTAAAVGYGIGTSGAETNHLLSDIDQMTQIGDQISKARTAAARTVPAQVEMYKSVEPDVEQLSSVLGRLGEEYAIYDRKFPAQHESIGKAIQSVQTAAMRMDLIRQQIAVAKLIENLDADAQLRMWEARMQPILDRENALDSAK
jgi:hypothetical protein